MIELEGISKKYGATVALRRTDLVFRRGENSVMMGPSGCGKSTLLRLLLGLIAPTTGRVLFDGEQLSPGNLQAVRRRVGYVIQGGGLFPHLTARRNVTLLARHLGWEKERREERLARLCALVRLPVSLMDRYPGELSGGQRQRVALMRALMLEPEALLLDEPLGALDPIVQRDLKEQLGDIFAELAITVVIVTHNMSVTAHFADRVILVNEGSVVQAGTLDELVRAPADPFVVEFINAQRSVQF